jgi:hypothetical protein
MRAIANRETECAPPKQTGEHWRRAIPVRHVQHPYNTLNAGQKQRLEAIRSQPQPSDDEQLIRELDAGCWHLAGRLVEARDSTGARLFIVIMGEHDILTGVKVVD